jgi:5'-nucleotidase
MLLTSSLFLVTLAACGDGASESSPSSATDASTVATSATTESTPTPPASPASSEPDDETPGETSDPAVDGTVSTADTASDQRDDVTILLTNDDGIASEGLDAVARALQGIDGVELVIVAPAENQSGKSDTTTPTLPGGTPAATASGIAGTAVAGTPADAILHALDVMAIEPDLVVSGANAGQNTGPFVALSGTVGAARTAARRALPAVAVSAGFAERPDYGAAAAVVAAEVETLIAAGLVPNTEQTVVNLNTPTCDAGTTLRGVIDVPVAAAFPEGVDGINLDFDCASTVEGPVDDVSALLVGYASRSIVPADLPT